MSFIIAECGSAHEKSLDKAHALILAAKAAGADAAKFQLWRNAEQLAQRRHAPELAEMYAKYQLPVEWLPELKTACDAAGLEFMCTAYVIEDIAVVAPHVKRFKIASFEAGDRNFLRAHVPYGMDMLISLGVTDHDRMERMLDARRGATSPGLRLLQCTSAYPAKAEELNLDVIRAHGLDGFSDHSDPALTWTGALAVAAGASIIEAHLRLDDTPKTNPDYQHSMKPQAFHEYVRHIRFADTCQGTSYKVIQPGEAETLAYRVV